MDTSSRDGTDVIAAAILQTGALDIGSNAREMMADDRLACVILGTAAALNRSRVTAEIVRKAGWKKEPNLPSMILNHDSEHIPRRLRRG